MVAENRGAELAGVIIFHLVFVVITIGLRCYSMGYILKRFFAEDWLAVVTLVFYIPYSAFALISIQYGLGQQVANVPLYEHPKALLFKSLGQIFYVIIGVFVKFIVGLFLLRICSHQRWQRIVIWILLGVVGIFNLFYVFIVIFQCIPVEFYWNRYNPNSQIQGKCNNTALAIIPTYVSLVLNVLSDWTLALLPVSFVWKAKMEMKRKVSVVVVLALGSIASMATVARIPYAKQLLSNPDYLYNFTDMAIWSTVEIGLSLSASSLATLKPLFRKFGAFTTLQTGSRFNSIKSSTLKGIGQLSEGSTMHSRKMSIPFNPRNFTIIKNGGVERMVSSTGRLGNEKGYDIEMCDLGTRDMDWKASVRKD